MTSTPTTADIAATAFLRRRSFAARQVREQRSTPADAEAKLAPWLALAAEAGADLPECFEPWEVIYPFDRAGETIQRRIRPDDIAPRDLRHAVLAKATVAQIEAQAIDPSPANTAAARDLLDLCSALGVRVEAPTEITVSGSPLAERTAA